MAPIGTKVVAPQSLCEQRTENSYHQRYPWPDRDAEHLQESLLGKARESYDRLIALTCLFAAVGLAWLVRWCA